MHILHLPSEYPTVDHKLGGIFTKELISQYPKKLKIGVIHIYLFSIKKIFSNLFFKIFVNYEYNKFIYRSYFVRIPYFRFINFWIYNYKIKKLLKQYFKKHGKPNLIHVHFSEFSSYAAYLIKKEFKIPYVITEHSTDFLDGRFGNRYKKNSKIYFFIKKIFQDSNYIICVSEILKKSICKTLKIDKKKIVVIPNTILEDNLQKYEKKIFDFIFVGTFEKRKNPMLILESFKGLLDKNLNLRLCLIGNGPLTKKINEYIYKNKINNYVKVFKNLTRKKVMKKIAQSKILCLSSYFETFGVVLIEAYSKGVPILITDSIGVRDVYNKKCGILLKNFTKKEFMLNMEKMIFQINNFKSKEIKKIFNQKYQSKIVINKTMELYKKCVD